MAEEKVLADNSLSFQVIDFVELESRQKFESRAGIQVFW